MLRDFVRGTILAIIFSVFIAMPGLSAKAAPRNTTPASSNLGNDISWPQCGKTFPVGQAFGIIGVNGGLANTTNDCMGQQLTWAQGSNGKTNQPKLQLYVNTANPGGLNTPSWPKDNTDPLGNSTTNPYGGCDGTVTTACAWQYGWNRAVEDVNFRFAPAANTAGINSSANLYNWWLDVETENSWETGSAGALERNRADLQGMTDYINMVGAKVGLYSTSTQWHAIAGTNNPGGVLNGLPSWLPGARNQKTAQSNCSLPPLTLGGQVTLTQFKSNNLDYDYSCI